MCASASRGDKVLDMIYMFFNEHKGVRRLGLLVWFALTAWATYRIFSNMTEVSPAVASCYATLVGAAAAYGWQYITHRRGE